MRRPGIVLGILAVSLLVEAGVTLSDVTLGKKPPGVKCRAVNKVRHKKLERQCSFDPEAPRSKRRRHMDLIQSESLVTTREDAELQWPVKKEADVGGDLILGGLMMVHEREDSRTCGPIMPQGGIQALETMLYTLDHINKDAAFRMSIGAHILDDFD
ncbi:unnamed protein product [Bemisia tabaci]|uniref:Uncharacterized protein n=1 Tax=Bemisia tabaci TaxID=7038 RepID=A0A9P0AFN7_BEMTA|nr:unnamed protein product [Bemisia tabaci]